MPRIVFVQSQVSQLDEPLYARLHQIAPASAAVVYWNDYGFSRTRTDPETGIVPDFFEPGRLDYPKQWIDSRTNGHQAVLSAVLALNPALVVLSDQPQAARLRLAIALRRRKIKVALRADKNQLSERPHTGVALLVERQIVQRAFDVLAPTSPLTARYYGWPSHRRTILSPYPTNERKFAPGGHVQAERRRVIRAELGIEPDMFVFVSATKFSARETPWELVECFAATAASSARVHLVALGDGPMLGEIRQACTERGVSRISFPGFVPFRNLQDYFFAADAYLHLVAVGPWEVSPQDALVAGLGVIATNNVGSAQVFLRGGLSRFLVPFGDRTTAAERMIEIASTPDIAAQFGPARARTLEYTVEATARRWLEVAA